MTTNTGRTRDTGSLADSQGGLQPHLLWVAGALLLLVSACGGGADGGGPGACAGKTCEYGVCQGGSCVNPESCGSSAGTDAGAAASCLPGYTCQDGTCEAQYSECDGDGDCAGDATCQKGACVNPDSCENAGDCLGDSVCADGSCQPNLCKNKEPCERGVCEPSTGECVDAETCSEDADCTEGKVCYNESCSNEETVCSDLDCENNRGVCDFEQKKCVNADTCESDNDCTEGNYCNDGSCETNQCDEQMKMCDRGVCEPGSAECVNPETCDAKADCLPDHLCVDNSCQPREEACGCPGNQVCNYDEENLSTTCEENSEEACRNSVDCVDNRVCRTDDDDGTNRCVDAGDGAEGGTCEADEFEPNNSGSEGTSIQDQGGSVDASLCPDDTDVFLYDRTQDDIIGDGLAVIDLEYDALDVGIGTLNVELQEPGDNGNYETIASAEAGDSNNEAGSIYFEQEVGIDTQSDTLRIRITSSGDMPEPGVRYDLFADIVSQDVSNACEQAGSLQTPEQTGDTTQGTSSKMSASCIAGSGEASEELYTFTLQKQSFVDLSVEPTGDSSDQIDLVASVRSTCASIGSELACANDTQGGGTEDIERTMEPGTYYLVVQGAESGQGGAYSISYNREDVVCTSSDNTCEDSTTAKVCRDDGTGFETVQCSNGCNQNRGVCNRRKGDVCRTAIDASNDLEDETIEWGNLENESNPGSNSCISTQDPATDGPDSIYEIQLDNEHALSAALELSSGQEGALYLLNGDCGSPAASCAKGVDSDEATETLTYENTSGSSQTLYLVADSVSGTTGQATLDVTSGEVICQPGDQTCQSGGIATCNDAGISYETDYQCPGACTNGTCNGDTCQTPIDLGKGGSQPIDMSKFQNDYTLSDGNSCTDDTFDGSDAAFQVTVPQDGWISVNVSSNRDDDDPSFYILDSCPSSSDHSDACLTGADEQTSFGDEPETGRYQVSSQGQYFVVVGSDDSGEAQGTFDVDIQTTESCSNPGTSQCTPQNQVQRCSQNGFPSTTTCSTSCQDGQCEGENCGAPLTMPTNQNQWSTTLDMSSFQNDYKLSDSGCAGDELPGNDAVVEIQADANDWISATVTPQDSGDDPVLYLTSQCGNTQAQENNCLVGADDNITGDPESLKTQLDSSGTYYLVVDADDADQDSGKFDLDVERYSPQCQQGDQSCASQTERQYCEAGQIKTQTCSDACRGGVCTGESCQAPIAASLTTGQSNTWQIDMSGKSNDYELSGSSCTDDELPGNDAVFEVQVPAGNWLKGTVTPQNSDDDPAIYVTTKCGDASTQESNCVAGQDEEFTGDPETVWQQAPQNSGKTYYVVVDSDDTDQDEGTFEVSLEIKQPTCQPGQGSCQNQSTAQFCGKRGIQKKTRNCGRTCTNGGCEADSCRSPKQVPTSQASNPNGWTTTLDTSKFNPDYNVSDSSCTGNKMPASDMVFAIEAKDANTWITATATPQNSDDDPGLYLLESCGSTSQAHEQSCIAGADEDLGGGGDAETLQTQVSSQGTYYLVVDADDENNIGGSWDLNVKVEETICTPGERSCTSQGNSEVCNSRGVAFETRTCVQGCTNGGCDVDTCTAPRQVTNNSFQETVDITNFNNDYELSDSSCVGDELPAPDLVYAVQMQSQQTLTASVDPQNSGDDPAIYVTETCGDTSAQESNCVVGADEGAGGDQETVQFATPQNTSGTYYVVVDGDDAGQATGQWQVDIEVQDFACTTGETRCSPQSADTLQYCGQFKQYNDYRQCSGGCSNGSCSNPSSNRCFDTIELEDGDSFQSSFSDFDNDFEPSSGACTYEDADPLEGPDAVFEVNLQQDDLLTANLETSQDEAGLFMVDSCPVTGNDCVRSENLSDQLQYRASSGGSYYLVVDSADGFADEDFSLDISVESSKSCIPDGAKCNQQSGDLDVCKSDGSGLRSTSYSCTNGCSGRVCNPPQSANDTCSGAYQVQGGLRMVDDWDRFSDSFDPGGSNYCVEDTEGLDAVYEVTLEAGQYVEAYVRPISSSDDPTVYILDDCQNPGNSCLAGNETSDEPVTTGYYNDTGSQKTVQVVVDSDSSFLNDDQFLLDLEVEDAECDPTKSPTPSQCVDSDTAEVCNDYGVYEEKNCLQGCNNGSCVQPSNNTCNDAETIQTGVSQTQTFRARHQQFANDYNSDTGSGQNCTGENTAGPDAVYSVQLNQGDLLDMEYDSANGDAALWVTTDCSNAAQNCVAGEDSGDPEELKFQAPQSGTYYVMADTDSDNANDVSGTYTLNVNYAGPPPSNNTCSGATPIQTGVSQTQTFQARHQQFTNDYNSDTGSGQNCTGEDTAGPDAVYSVDLAKDDIIDMEYESADDDAALWVTTDCSNAAQNCVAGEDSDDPDKLTFQASQSGTYYVMADTDSDDAKSVNGTYTLNVNYVGPPQCQQGETRCADSTTLEYCSNGVFKSYACPQSCSISSGTASCSPSGGQICADAIPMSSGDSDTQSYGTRNNFNPGTGQVGSCNFGDEPVAGDHVYSVDLQQGDTLEASYSGANSNGSSFGIIYLLRDCQDVSTCQTNSSAGSSGSITYNAQGQETVYVVMDRTLDFNGNQFDYKLDINIK